MSLLDLRLQRRQASHAPCPTGNGTMIGGDEKFIVFCDTRFQGDELLRQKVDSLGTCTDLCMSFQNPRCEGAQLQDNGDCVLVGNLVPEGTRPSRFFDSAAAVFPQPGPTSSCSLQGTGTTFLSQSSSFSLQCGKIANGNDLEQQFQMTLESCLGACAANAACGGVSFDPSQTAGFKNCYLKAAITTADLFAKTGVDSAIRVNPANQAAVPDTSTSALANAVATTLTAAISEAPVPSTSPASVVTVSVPVPVTSTPVTSALADSTPEPSATTTPVADGNGRGGMNINNGRPRFGNPSANTPSSNAWIAAPVIGSIAALTLILAIFVLWGRRRRRENPPADDEKAPGPMAARAAALGHFGRGLGDVASRVSRGRIFGGGGGSDRTRLGSSDLNDDPRYGTNRGGFKVVSGSGRRLGLDGQEISGTGPGLGGMIVTTGGGKVVTMNMNTTANASANTGAGAGAGVRSSSSASSVGLRDSQNGLRQNRLTGNWFESQPGIPAEFRGPDIA
ncbi:hypothetical protein GGS24DRAFT_495891 [Hypoxylon argillaceum]|nr:hypothetical protein GGS24DRAFT_495891 [Hypoxylon argillaceum]